MTTKVRFYDYFSYFYNVILKIIMRSILLFFFTIPLILSAQTKQDCEIYSILLNHQLVEWKINKETISADSPIAVVINNFYDKA